MALAAATQSRKEVRAAESAAPAPRAGPARRTRAPSRQPHPPNRMMHRRVRWGVRFVMIGLVPDHLARPQHAAILNDSAARGENGDYIGDEGPRQRQQPLPPAIAARGEMQAHADRKSTR